MKTGRTSAATLGVVGGIALGMWIASAMTLMEPRTPREPAQR